MSENDQSGGIDPSDPKPKRHLLASLRLPFQKIVFCCESWRSDFDSNFKYAAGELLGPKIALSSPPPLH